MDLYRNAIDIAKWPLNRTIDIGAFVLRSSGQEHIADRLRMQEPRARALTALKTARRALDRDSPDEQLAGFEVMRASVAAANAVDQDNDLNSKLTEEIGLDIVNMALDLPHSVLGDKLTERATAVALESLAPPHDPESVDAHIVSIRGISKQRHKR